jgi:preprotein translocase subunit SecY
MWLGELITQRGIGNGISLMIFASIVRALDSGPSAHLSRRLIHMVGLQ